MDKKKDIMESEPNEKCAKRVSTHEPSSSKKKIKKREGIPLCIYCFVSKLVWCIFVTIILL